MSAGIRWQPAASREALSRRAQRHAAIRARFAAQGVIEVDTPVLAQSSCLDPQVPSYAVPTASGTRYLQTSPEHHMKRLLAAGSGPIYRLGPVFRADERGRWHAPEFTMLEWYRPGFDDQRLMRDVAELVAMLGGPTTVVRHRYWDLIAAATGIAAPREDLAALRGWCADHGLETRTAADADIDLLLDFIIGVHVGPGLGSQGLAFVTHFPASQAALAQLDPDEPAVARRFELYWQGLELANGFDELCDAGEQRQRFVAEQAARADSAAAPIPLDERLLAALAHGLPPVAGVALGIDRLYALLDGADTLDAVHSFPWEDA